MSDNLDWGYSPITIKFMLACYTGNTSEIEPQIWDSSAGKETRALLQSNGLVDANYLATPRGNAWVKYICATPMPEQVWQLPKRGTP